MAGCRSWWCLLVMLLNYSELALNLYNTAHRNPDKATHLADIVRQLGSHASIVVYCRYRIALYSIVTLRRDTALLCPCCYIKLLSFCYPGSNKSTIANIKLTINQGEMLVLVGENGAGKTTLGKLLGRLYDPTSGTIAWNGKDLRSYSLAYVRSRIAVVMQDYARFPSTVRENVGFGDLLSLSDDTAINEAIS